MPVLPTVGALLELHSCVCSQQPIRSAPLVSSLSSRATPTCGAAIQSCSTRTDRPVNSCHSWGRGLGAPCALSPCGEGQAAPGATALRAPWLRCATRAGTGSCQGCVVKAVTHPTHLQTRTVSHSPCFVGVTFLQFYHHSYLYNECPKLIFWFNGQGDK